MRRRRGEMRRGYKEGEEMRKSYTDEGGLWT